ncbi:ABC transporter substrate-binding protein [Roseomonas sp. 18066]|uniref:ABC transporter substrate-binding protein n=1 Tax=Roseomonas sp. 18066 TaxID=2681412 RepID=UPI001359FFD6|nr:ABC transporter substrate-binding protein [Roseomonas sp. 18066]
MRLLLALACFLMVAAAPRAQDFVDDAGRRVALPSAPLRVVTLHDSDLALPLLELGVTPVASTGRLDSAGKPFLRGAMTLVGTDFAEAGIGFLGIGVIDAEAVALARPDLILTPAAGATPVAQLQRIAPTVVIDDTRRSLAETYALLARLVGREAEAARLERRYQAQLTELRRAWRPERFSVAVISARGDGKLALDHTYGALGTVLRDAGFRFPALIEAIPPQRQAVVSPELLPELDADFLIDTYRNDRLEPPAAAHRRLARVHPEYCRYLRACREGRFLVLPRDEAVALSYAARSLAIGMVTGMLARQAGP